MNRINFDEYEEFLEKLSLFKQDHKLNKFKCLVEIDEY